MISDLNIQERLSFIALVEQSCITLKKIKPLLEPVLPIILRNFYTHISSWPGLIDMHGNGRASIEAATVTESASSQISTTAEEQNTAASEIARSANEAAVGTADVNNNIAHMASIAGESSDASTQSP